MLSKNVFSRKSSIYKRREIFMGLINVLKLMRTALVMKTGKWSKKHCPFLVSNFLARAGNCHHWRYVKKNISSGMKTAFYKIKKNLYYFFHELFPF